MYYDGTKLLSMLDGKKEKPEILISCGNRSQGKTTFFNRLLINRFKNRGEKFILLYRYKYELSNISQKFFNDINVLFFPTDKMTEKKVNNGLFIELFLNDESCGYALSINSADKIKTCSHIFCDVETILFDEFQASDGNYCQNEIDKFISIHMSVARGRGKVTRPVQCILISNFVSVINPYFSALNISHLITPETKFLRGNGVVCEFNKNDSVSTALMKSKFAQAFNGNGYINHASNNEYIDDNNSFVEKLKGKKTFICTLVLDEKFYTLFECNEYAYVSKNGSKNNDPLISCNTNSHKEGQKLLDKNSPIIVFLRKKYQLGETRFSDLTAKQCFLQFISY